MQLCSHCSFIRKYVQQYEIRINVNKSFIPRVVSLNQDNCQSIGEFFCEAHCTIHERCTVLQCQETCAMQEFILVFKN